MQLDKVKRLAATLLKTGKDNVWLSPDESDKIKEVITKDDVRELISKGTIKKKKKASHSRGRARILMKKKKKGRKKGEGKRKGTSKKRMEKKKTWIKNVRAQRRVLKELKKKYPDKVKKIGYGKIYKRIKGNFFKGKKYVEAAVKEGGKSSGS